MGMKRLFKMVMVLFVFLMHAMPIQAQDVMSLDRLGNVLHSFEEEPFVSSEEKYPIELILYKAFEMDSKTESSQLIAEFAIIDINKRQRDTFKSNQEGIGIWHGDLEKGSYMIREINTASNYLIDERSFGFEVMGRVNEVIIINEGEAIVNRLQRYTLKVHINDAAEKMLANTEYSLYDEKFELIDQGVSDENGIIYFNALKIGNYYLKETQAPKGYALDDTLSKIELLDDMELKLLNQRGEAMKVYPKTGIIAKQNDQEDVLSAIILSTILLLIIIGYKRYKNTI